MIDRDALVRLQEASFARAEGGLRSSWPRESGMDAEQLRSFLDGHRYCVLATTTTQRHPVARLVAFTVVGASGNDGLHWPRRDGLKWPHLASVVVGVDVA